MDTHVRCCAVTGDVRRRPGKDSDDPVVLVAVGNWAVVEAELPWKSMASEDIFRRNCWIFRAVKRTAEVAEEAASVWPFAPIDSSCEDRAIDEDSTFSSWDWRAIFRRLRYSSNQIANPIVGANPIWPEFISHSLLKCIWKIKKRNGPAQPGKHAHIHSQAVFDGCFTCSWSRARSDSWCPPCWAETRHAAAIR